MWWGPAGCRYEADDGFDAGVVGLAAEGVQEEVGVWISEFNVIDGVDGVGVHGVVLLLLLVVVVVLIVVH